MSDLKAWLDVEGRNFDFSTAEIQEVCSSPLLATVDIFLSSDLIHTASCLGKKLTIHLENKETKRSWQGRVFESHRQELSQDTAKLSLSIKSSVCLLECQYSQLVFKNRRVGEITRKITEVLSPHGLQFEFLAETDEYLIDTLIQKNFESDSEFLHRAWRKAGLRWHWQINGSNEEVCVLDAQGYRGGSSERELLHYIPDASHEACYTNPSACHKLSIHEFSTQTEPSYFNKCISGTHYKHSLRVGTLIDIENYSGLPDDLIIRSVKHTIITKERLLTATRERYFYHNHWSAMASTTPSPVETPVLMPKFSLAPTENRVTEQGALLYLAAKTGDGLPFKTIQPYGPPKNAEEISWQSLLNEPAKGLALVSYDDPAIFMLGDFDNYKSLGPFADEAPNLFGMKNKAQMGFSLLDTQNESRLELGELSGENIIQIVKKERDPDISIRSSQGVINLISANDISLQNGEYARFEVLGAMSESYQKTDILAADKIKLETDKVLEIKAKNLNLSSKDNMNLVFVNDIHISDPEIIQLETLQGDSSYQVDQGNIQIQGVESFSLDAGAEIQIRVTGKEPCAITISPHGAIKFQALKISCEAEMINFQGQIEYSAFQENPLKSYSSQFMNPKSSLDKGPSDEACLHLVDLFSLYASKNPLPGYLKNRLFDVTAQNECIRQFKFENEHSLNMKGGHLKSIDIKEDQISQDELL